MASNNGKALHLILTYIPLIVITSASSSKCDASVLYEYIYCLSSDSPCVQCIPCYNDGSLYIPTGQTYALDCSDITCTKCTKTCANNFKNQTYIHANNILSTFISKIDTNIISLNNNNTTKHSFNCTHSDSVLSIKYAFIAPNNNNDIYTNVNYNLQSCTSDISHDIKSQCNNKKTCDFDINSSLLPQNCINNILYNAYIGSFCIFNTPPNNTNTDCSSSISAPTVSDESIHFIYLIIIIILATVLFIIIVIIILCLIKNLFLSNSEMQKTATTSTSTLNNFRVNNSKFNSINIMTHSASMQDGNNNNTSTTEPKMKISSSIQMGDKMSSHLRALRNRTLLQSSLHNKELNKSVTMDTPVPDSPSAPITAPMTSDKSDTIRSMVLAENGQYKTIHLSGNNVSPLPLPLTVDKTRSNQSMDINNKSGDNSFREELAYMLMNPNDDIDIDNFNYNNNGNDDGMDYKHGNIYGMGNKRDSNKNLYNKIQCIPHTEYQLVFEIGRGTTSKVYKVRWINQEVAAKRFFNTFDIDNIKSQKYIDKYAQKLMDSPHDNVIKILAFANSPFTIITEYINYGSVKKYVESKRVSIIDRICITLQASKGIQHLHKLNIIHSEIMCNTLLMEFKNGINTRNINDIRVVITDYALQSMLTDDGLDAYRSSLGPLKWMAPELIENHNTNTTLKTDIYAFGITIWEIITGKEPYTDTKAVDAAIHVLIKERRPQQFAFIPEKIQALMKECWHTNHQKRPNAQYIVNQLNKYIHNQSQIVNVKK